MGCITALTAISVGMLIPTVGVVARDFGVPESQGAWLVGGYFLAFAAGQVFWGLFSDAYGRRRSLILCLSGFLFASLACALATDFLTLIAFRLVQGLMGGTPVIARAMVRDVASGREAARLIAVLAAILTVASVIAPIFGSALLFVSGWRAAFLALAFFTTLALGYLFLFVDETLSSRRPERFSIRFLRQAGQKLIQSQRFITPAVVGGLTFAGYVSVGAIGAITLEAQYGVSPEAFGGFFVLVALSNTGGALLATRLLKRMSLDEVNLVAVSTLSIAAIANLTLAFIEPSLEILWLFVCLYVLALGLILPTTTAASMESSPEMPGFAASVYGSLQMAAGSIGSLFASTLYSGAHHTICVILGVLGLVAGLVYVVASRLAAGNDK